MSEVPVTIGRNFVDATGSSPCDGCSAPCCRMNVFPHPAPQTFQSLDYLRFVVGHAGTELLVDRDGTWKVLVWTTCDLLTADGRCSVHATSRQPKTCTYFNPYNCWYKRNFHETEEPPDVVRLDAAAFEQVLTKVTVDDDGFIIDAPRWPELRELAAATRRVAHATPDVHSSPS